MSNVLIIYSPDKNGSPKTVAHLSTKGALLKKKKKTKKQIWLKLSIQVFRLWSFCINLLNEDGSSVGEMGKRVGCNEHSALHTTRRIRYEAFSSLFNEKWIAFEINTSKAKYKIKVKLKKKKKLYKIINLKL